MCYSKKEGSFFPLKIMRKGCKYPTCRVNMMLCPICGKPVTDEFEFCPNCGTSLKQAAPEAETAPETQPTPAPTPEVAPEAAPEVAPEAAPEAQAFAQADFQETPKKKKKKKPLKVLAIVMALVAVLGILCVIFWPTIYGFVLRTVGAPETYFQYVEKKAAVEVADSVSEFYDVFLESANVSKNLNATTGTVRIQMSDELAALLGDNLNVEDLAWLKDTCLKFNTTYDGELSMLTALLTISDTEVVDFTAILNAMTSEYYIGIPSLSEVFLHYDPEEYFDTAGSALSSYSLQKMLQDEAFMEALPSRQQVNTLLRRYLELIIDNITSVKKDTDTLTIGGYEQKVTVLEYRMTQRNLMKILKAVLKEAKTDRDLKRCINDFATYLQTQGVVDDVESVYPSFQDAVEQALTALNTAEGSSETLFVLTDYVNTSNEVIGRKLEIDGETILEYATVTKGDNFATEISIGSQESTSDYDDYETAVPVINQIKLTGKGTLSKGNREGNYVLEVGGLKYLNIFASYNEDKLSSGKQLKGHFRVTLTEEALATLDSQTSLLLSAMNIGIELVVDADDTQGYMELNLVSGEKMLVGLVIESQVAESAPITMPDNYYSIDYADYWLMGLDFDKLISALEEANVPEEIIDMLVSNLDYMFYDEYYDYYD